MDSNGNEIFSASDMEGEENPNHQTVETGEMIIIGKEHLMVLSVMCP